MHEAFRPCDQAFVLAPFGWGRAAIGPLIVSTSPSRSVLDLDHPASAPRRRSAICRGIGDGREAHSRFINRCSAALSECTDIAEAVDNGRIPLCSRGRLRAGSTFQPGLPSATYNVADRILDTLMVALPSKAEIGRQICRTDHDPVETSDGRDLLGVLNAMPALDNNQYGHSCVGVFKICVESEARTTAAICSDRSTRGTTTPSAPKSRHL
jgi:hypothetical protein